MGLSRVENACSSWRLRGGPDNEERDLPAKRDFSDAQDEAQSEVDFLHEVVRYPSDRFI